MQKNLLSGDNVFPHCFLFTTREIRNSIRKKCSRNVKIKLQNEKLQNYFDPTTHSGPVLKAKLLFTFQSATGARKPV